MRLGVIFCAYDAEDQIDRSLEAWITMRRSAWRSYNVEICAVSVLFEGFEERDNEKTRDKLYTLLNGDVIDKVISSISRMKETEARGQALDYLVQSGCDAVCLVDSDEDWDVKSIEKTLDFVYVNPFVSCFRVCYKNLVFSKNQYLAEPFTPPRIFRTNIKVSRQDFKIAGFRDDNNVFYKNSDNPAFVLPDTDLPWLTVPKNLAWIPHETWLNDLRSKRKCEYQEKRWSPPHGFGCSFAWDDSRGGLIFNEDYYQRSGQPFPKVITENS